MRALCACVLLAAGAVQAAGTGQLQARDINSDGVVDAYYDPAANLSWLADANWALTNGADYYGLMPWGRAGGGVPTDVYGVTGWRLPTATVFCPPDDPFTDCRPVAAEFPSFSDLSLFRNVQRGYWTSTIYESIYGYAQIVLWDSISGLGATDEAELYLSVWAVHDGDVIPIATPAPEPSTYALMAIGLIALICASGCSGSRSSTRADTPLGQ